MKKLYIILSNLIFLLLISNVVMAQEFLAKPWLQNILGWIRLDTFFAQNPQVLYAYILTFVASLAIIMGLLMQLNLFSNIEEKSRNRIYFVIALAWSGLLIPTGILGTVVLTIFTVAGTWANVLVVGVFILSSVFWGYRTVQYHRAAGVGEISSQISTAISNLEKEEEDIVRRYLGGAGITRGTINRIIGDKRYRNEDGNLVAESLTGVPNPQREAIRNIWPTLRGAISHTEREIGSLQATAYEPSRRLWLWPIGIIGLVALALIVVGGGLKSITTGGISSLISLPFILITILLILVVVILRTFHVI